MTAAGADYSAWDPTMAQAIRCGHMQFTSNELLGGDWAKGPQGTGQTDWQWGWLGDLSLETGELAESWEMPNATTIIYHIRQGARFFLNPKEEDGDPYESSQITALIANASGIYGVYSYREVFSFDRFWGIGSGRNFALGAMYATYDRTASARRIAEIGVKAGAEFDKSSSLPARVFSVAAQFTGDDTA